MAAVSSHEKREALTARGGLLITSALAAPSGQEILEECMGLAELLIVKNAKYGDSALNPLRVFSKADPSEQIRVRLDDKLSRLSRGDTSMEDEDVLRDLLGYLILLRVATKRKGG